MKKLCVILSLALTLTAFAAPTHATTPGHSKIQSKVCMWLPFVCEKLPNKGPKTPKGPKGPKGPPAVHEVPEINGATTGLALALLSGILAIGRERRRNRRV